MLWIGNIDFSLVGCVLFLGNLILFKKYDIPTSVLAYLDINFQRSNPMMVPTVEAFVNGHPWPRDAKKLSVTGAGWLLRRIVL